VAPLPDGELLFREPTEARAQRRAAILQRQGFEPRIERPVLRLVIDNMQEVRT
jgi:hypothetical protein